MINFFKKHKDDTVNWIKDAFDAGSLIVIGIVALIILVNIGLIFALHSIAYTLLAICLWIILITLDLRIVGLLLGMLLPFLLNG